MRRTFIVLLLAAACTQPPPELLSMPATDMSTLEPAVRTRISAAHADFERRAQRGPAAAELADAYGELGMIYHAQDLTAPAEVAYINAHRLAPRDKRWPYLLAHLYADASKLPQAMKTFETVLAIDDKDVPTQIYLGQLYFQNGELDKAQALFERALADKDARAAALSGLGKVALAQGQYRQAVERLEEALKLWPNASRLRQPLAMAYRGLGDSAKAQANLARHVPNGAEPGLSDPTVDLMSSKVVVSRVLLRRGQRYGKEGRFDLAEKEFRAAVASDPTNAEALANLGISLANLGRTEEAQARLIESLALDDTSALAHFSLAVVYDRQDLEAAAIEQYFATIQRDPGNVQALVYLADARMRSGSAAEAARFYRQALDKSADSPRIAISLAMALIRAGRHAEARKVLETAYSKQPRNAEIINALARLLATAPQASVRDGPRALKMAKSLFEATRSLTVGQTYAMAFAETGNFEEAVKLHKETIIGYQRSGSPVDQAFLQRNLRLYEQGKPAREGWSAGDAAFQPRSPAAARVTAPAS